MPQAILSNDPSKDTGEGERERRRGVYTPPMTTYEVVTTYEVRLETPDGRVVRLGYDLETAKEVVRSFAYTRVKASVEKVKHRLKVAS